MQKSGIRNIVLLFLCIINVNITVGQKFAIISDIHGASEATLQVSILVKSWNPDFIITAGDNNYASLNNIDGQVGQFYSSFISPYSGIYGLGDTINRFFPALGNHDDEFGGTASFVSYFTLPGNERYYDFVKGDVHFFCLNSNPDEPDGVSDTSFQAIWLKNKLQNSSSDYNIVYFHHPAFSSGPHGNTSYMQWPFKQWGATAVFSGHDHTYERIELDNLNYFVCGTGGGALYSIINPIPGSQFHDVSDHGAMLVEVKKSNISFKFINTNDSIIDSISIPLFQTNKINNHPTIIDSGIKIYPNPASDYVYIDTKNESGNISLYDNFGHELFSNIICNQSFIHLKVNLSDLKKGVYFIKICNNSYTESKKLIIN